MDEAFRTYDVVVIGAGPVGENVADRARAAGLSTVIVERELLGGECSFWACEPSKALGGGDAARGRTPCTGLGACEGLDVDAVLAHRDRMARTEGRRPGRLARFRLRGLIRATGDSPATAGDRRDR